MPSGARLRRAVHTIPPARMLIGLVVVAALTVIAAVAGYWAASVAGVLVVHLGSVLVVLLAVGRIRTAPAKASPPAGENSTRALRQLEQRMDVLAARLLASSERTRVEVLDAVGRSAADPDVDDAQQ